jgi:hypothetical protein
MRYPPYIEADFTFPGFYHVRLRPEGECIADVASATAATVDRALSHSPIRSGDTVAVAVGSRGMANLALMVRTICQRLQHVGAHPFIVPAMGSHGGATAEGQVAILAHLGVSEAACGASVRFSMAAEPIATVYDDVPVFYARDIAVADHAVCLNRIKPHTKFKGPLESGLAKMLCVGMGKHDGALAYHRWALQYGFFPLLREMAQAVLTHGNLRFGVAVVENARDETCHIEAIPAGRILEREPDLLTAVKEHFPRLPFNRLDVLAIQTIGKEISGAGMDPNVTGRAFDLMESDFSERMQATRVAILNLSTTSGGNAIGLGNADIITEKVFQAMDYEATLMNALTSLSLHKAFIPVRLPSDRKALQACFNTLGPKPAAAIEAVIIRDTRHVNEFLASAALVQGLQRHPAAAIVDGPSALNFDAADDLITPWQHDEGLSGHPA